MKDVIAKVEGQAKAFGKDSGASLYGAYIGLDVHKDTIAWAVALPGSAEPTYCGEIAHTAKALSKWWRPR